jgi:hypothetical protein
MVVSPVELYWWWTVLCPKLSQPRWFDGLATFQLQFFTWFFPFGSSLHDFSMIELRDCAVLLKISKGDSAKFPKKWSAKFSMQIYPDNEAISFHISQFCISSQLCKSFEPRSKVKEGLYFKIGQ